MLFRSVLVPGQRASSGLGYSQVRAAPRRESGYGWAELAERVDVSIPTLRDWVLRGYFRHRGAVDGAGARIHSGVRCGAWPGTTSGVQLDGPLDASIGARLGARLGAPLDASADASTHTRADAPLDASIDAAPGSHPTPPDPTPSPTDSADPTGFTAVDVVRLEVLARLVRSGVPVARAAELVHTPE